MHIRKPLCRKKQKDVDLIQKRRDFHYALALEDIPDEQMNEIKVMTFRQLHI